jgi:predicted  nucleic acid-binding Zn-ribbon protein
MQAIGIDLLIAVAATGVLAAMTFRHLTGTLIQLNDELKEAIQERHTSETERDTLRSRVTELEGQVAQLKVKLESQACEIQALQTRLKHCDELVALLQNNAMVSPSQLTNTESFNDQ